jgi:hypothetical protein
MESSPGDISSNSDKNNVKDINLMSADNEMLLQEASFTKRVMQLGTGSPQ